MTILPELKQHVVDAAVGQRPARSRSRARVRLAAVGPRLVAGLSVAVAILVAVVALTALRHGTVQSSTRPGAARSVAVTRQELIASLAVLRQPQTKLGRDSTKLERELRDYAALNLIFELRRRHEPVPAGLEQTERQWGFPEVDASLVRVVTVSGARIGVIPTTWQPSAASRQRATGLNLTVRAPHSDGMTGTGPRPIGVEDFLAHGLAIFAAGPNDADFGAVLVPDGVAKVTLGPLRVAPKSAPIHVSQAAIAAKIAAIPSVTATVTDNVAAIRLAVPTLHVKDAVSSLFGANATAQATWWNASGQVIKRTTVNVDVLVRVHGGKRARTLRQILCARHRALRICHR